MIRQWLKISVLSIASVACVLHGATENKSATMSGHGAFEGGFGYGSNSGSKDYFFLVDQAVLGHTFGVTENTKIVFENIFSANSYTNAPAASQLQNGAFFTSKYRLTSTGTNGTLQMANSAFALEHNWGNGMTWWVGHFKTPFGMESMWSRYEMPTFYLSAASQTLYNYNWMYDVGVKFQVVDAIPGKLEFTLTDGRNNVGGDYLGPADAIRWSYDYNGGDWSFMPVISGYFGRWRGGPKDIGATIGGQFKMGQFWGNLEWLYLKQDSSYMAGGADKKTWDLIVEPGFNLGFAEISAKYELYNSDSGAGGQTDHNIAVALGKTYMDKVRVRLVFQQSALAKKLSTVSTSDVRLLVGTQF